jgi:hypothetical protein
VHERHDCVRNHTYIQGIDHGVEIMHFTIPANQNDLLCDCVAHQFIEPRPDRTDRVFV